MVEVGTADGAASEATDDDVDVDAYGSFDSVVAGGGFTSQYAPAVTARITVADATIRAAPTHWTHACTRVSTDIDGAGRSGISITEAPYVSGRESPIERLGEAMAEHIGRAPNYDATRSESSSRTAVAT